MTKHPNRKKLLLPNTLAKAGWALLEARDDVEGIPYAPGKVTPELLALLPEADGIALSVTPFGAQELEAAPRMRVVARIGVGYDAVDVAALSARGVPLMVTGTANSPSVAENALYLMLALAKRGRELDEMVRAGRWTDRFTTLPYDLFGKTVLVVGFGRIGTRTAKRCLAFDMTVLVHDPYVAADAVRAAGCEVAAELDAALPRADFVTVHCPKNAETTGLIGAARLARMKPSAYLVNTARGGIVDEQALDAALAAGRIAGAGIDVFAEEPAPASHPLLRHRNVLVAPHMAGVTAESMDRMAVATVHNMLQALDGHPNRSNVVNKDVLNKDVAK